MLIRHSRLTLESMLHVICALSHIAIVCSGLRYVTASLLSERNCGHLYQQRFQLSLPDELAEMVPNKEEMSIMKVETHSGDVAFVYCLHKNPIFFEMKDNLFPTGENVLFSLFHFCFNFRSVKKEPS